MLFSIGYMKDRAGEVVPLVRVTADAPDEPISGVHRLGDDDFVFMTAINAVSDLLIAEQAPTPLLIALEMMGRDATVHQVKDDGSLRGWRRDYVDPGLSLSDLR